MDFVKKKRFSTILFFYIMYLAVHQPFVYKLKEINRVFLLFVKSFD